MRLGAFVSFKVFYNLHKLCEEIIQYTQTISLKYLIDSDGFLFQFKIVICDDYHMQTF